VLSYQITLDGTKLTHDRQRPLSGGGSSYNMIVGNLHMIKTNVKSKSFLVLLRINITKSIIDQFETYLCNLENLLQNDSRFHISYNIVADWGGDRIDGFRDELIQRDEEIIGILNEKIVNSKTGIGIKNVVTGLGGSINFNPGCHVDRHNSYTIDSSGAISKCAQEIRTDHVPLGDLSDINWGLNQYEVARWMSPAQYEIPEKCRPCHMLPTGCYRAYSCVVHRFEHKYIDSAPPQELKCPVAKSNLPTLICEMDLAGKSISLTENEKGVA
jgi:radical SAM protein with 4Fe4S-binding SPASM domain